MRGFPRCLPLSKQLMPLLAALLLTSSPSSISAEPTRGGTLKLITQEVMERLRPEWARTDEPDKRKALVEEIQRLVYDEVPYVTCPSGSGRSAVLTAAR